MAKRLVLVLTAVGTAVTVLFATVGPTAHVQPGVLVSVVGPLVLLVLAIGVVVMPAPTAWMWTGYPLFATTMIVLTDLASHDASVTGQLFFFFPVLYAGAQLCRQAAVVICLAASAAEVLVVASQLPVRAALVDGCFVAAALATTTGILVYSGEQVDHLIGRLREQAAIDPLTGLVTRRVLDSAVMSSLKSAGGDGGTALVIIDIDHFKRINDDHGHPVGDLVLREVSDAVRQASRRTDTVCRMGGDELAVLLPGCSLSDARRHADQLLQHIQGLSIDVSKLSMSTPTSDDHDHRVHVTASVGLAHLPTHAHDVHDLYRAADAALYRAKQAGRNQVSGPLISMA